MLFLIRWQALLLNIDVVIGKLHNSFVISGCFDKSAAQIRSKTKYLTRALLRKTSILLLL